MNSKEKREFSNLSIKEAVETLTSIAEIDWEQPIDDNRGPSHIQQRYRNLMHLKNPKSTISAARELFKVILKHLQGAYSGDKTSENKKKIEGIKNIMVLVGEAAEKLDKLTYLFKNKHSKSITQYPEFKKLQEFYKERIARREKKQPWNHTISPGNANSKESKKNSSVLAKKSYVDFDAITKDESYELLFIRKEDGTRYFSPRLIKNIKLICNFGKDLSGKAVGDPLEQAKSYLDRCAQKNAKQIEKELKDRIDLFLQEYPNFLERELVKTLNKAFLALMLSASPDNLYKTKWVKSCLEYYHDFQHYLRDVVCSSEYQRLLAYQEVQQDGLAEMLLHIIHDLCVVFFENQEGQIESIPFIEDLLSEAHDQFGEPDTDSIKTWEVLSKENNLLTKLVAKHPYGPLVKIIDSMENDFDSFDPLSQNMIPHSLFLLAVPHMKMKCLRLPCPTVQESIHKGTVADEFKSYLRACSTDQEKRILLFNLQNPGSWKENLRVSLLEDLQNSNPVLKVISLQKDSDFYHQVNSHKKQNHADVFMKELAKELNSSIKSIGSEIHLPVDLLLDSIHRVFFSRKNALSRGQRLDFIELAHMFLKLKALDIYSPQTFSFICKDGIDKGAVSAAELYAFMKMLNGDLLDRRILNMILYAPALLYRERLVNGERFSRFLNFIRCIESAKEQYGSNFSQVIHEVFGKFYNKPILSAKVLTF